RPRDPSPRETMTFHDLSRLRPTALLLSCALVCASATAANGAVAADAPQEAPPARCAVPAAAPNPQLVAPDVEHRVDALLEKMTLAEKIGQLVQYNDQGA